MCVCVRERETDRQTDRERERETERERERECVWRAGRGRLFVS